MPVLEMHYQQTPAERVLQGAGYALSNEELLSVVMDSDIQLAQHLTQKCSLGEGIWTALPEDLLMLDGIQPHSVARVLACLEVSKRSAIWKRDRHIQIDTPEDVVQLCNAHFKGVNEEHFLLLPLNTRNCLIRLLEISIGSLDVSIVHPRELFREAIQLSAASVVLVHNHPSGDPTPSPADIKLTRRLVECGELLGVEVIDHLVIGDKEHWVSFREEGLI